MILSYNDIPTPLFAQSVTSPNGKEDSNCSNHNSHLPRGSNSSEVREELAFTASKNLPNPLLSNNNNQCLCSSYGVCANFRWTFVRQRKANVDSTLIQHWTFVHPTYKSMTNSLLNQRTPNVQPTNNKRTPNVDPTLHQRWCTKF